MAPSNKRESVTVREATLLFKNFAGEQKQFNPAGQRNFSILLTAEDAERLQQKGYNVKPLRRQDDDDEQMYHLKVKVTYANRPPRVWLVSGQGTRRTMLGEGLVAMLDQLDSVRVDLEFTPYDWTLASGTSGRTAYLETLFFHMYESELELEYAHLEELPSAGEIKPLAIGAGPDDVVEAELVD